ncbi:unnamed protein product [Closterium sp. Naga37s-1]|nr:unnamed protein product [Closterium sp. Naga37s-1]
MGRVVILAVAAFAIVSLYSSYPVAAYPIAGGWSVVKDAYKNKDVRALASFAVEQHNSDKNTNLQLDSVTAAWRQVVAGIKWKIVLRAVDPVSPTKGRAPTKYVAEVWEKSWEDFRQLLSFKEVTTTSPRRNSRD